MLDARRSTLDAGSLGSLGGKGGGEWSGERGACVLLLLLLMMLGKPKSNARRLDIRETLYISIVVPPPQCEASDGCVARLSSTNRFLCGLAIWQRACTVSQSDGCPDGRLDGGLAT